MIEKIYNRLLRLTSRSGEKGEYSAGYWQSKVRQTALALCSSSLGSLLEVGCGEALFLAELAALNNNIELHGVDNWDKILQKARQRLGDKGLERIKLYQAEATALPFDEASFDAVVCVNVIFNLESVEKAEKVFKEMSRVCKKSGRIIFDFRNARNPFLYVKYKLAPYYDHTVKNLPLKTYRLEDISRLLDAAGLKIIKRMPIGSPVKWMAPVIILQAEKI